MKRFAALLVLGMVSVGGGDGVNGQQIQGRGEELAARILRAGAATSVITPELGVNIVGGFAPVLATHVHDELHARCLVLDDGKTKVALVICDLLGMHRKVSVEARRLIQEQCGIMPEHVLIAATHTHSAGSALGAGRYQQGAELDAYQQLVAKRVADGVKRANDVLRPAELAFGSVEAPEHVHNRRWVMKEGTAPVNPFGKVDKVKMNPPRASENLIEPSGPIDPTLSFFVVRELGGARLIGFFGAYSLHYVGGVGPGHISADYFAMFCQALESTQPVEEKDGRRFIAMLANGTSGDINNIDFKKTPEKQEPYAQMQLVAEDLAGKVEKVMEGKLEWKSDVILSGRYREIELERKPLSDELIEWAKQTKASEGRVKGKVDLSQVYADRVLSLAPLRGEKLVVPLQLLMIGEIGIGTFPTETFAETGLEFKKRSTMKHPFMVELAHGYLGYLPTPRHFELGGYETWPGTNQLEPEASVKMMEVLLKMEKE